MAVALVGPTASGKSAVAHELACDSTLGIEILSVDSMTVYRGMDIGTAKATAEQRAEVPYHLLDLVEPSEEFTVSQFQHAARESADLVWALGGAVLYVGGTGLYGRAVIDNFEIPGQYPEIRAALEARRDDLAVLYAELEALDPVGAAKMEPTNERRILRALEVTLGSGRPFSAFGGSLREYEHTRVVQIGLMPDFETLDQRIEERFRTWMDEGLLAEVARLAASGMGRTARQAVGYRELLEHLEAGRALEDCVTDAITQSRRLARRQRSWFSRDPRVQWVSSAAEASDRIAAVLSSPDGFVRD
jgi:tRNA dimethylallyltransferase